MGLAAAVGIAEVAFSMTAILSSVAIVGAVVSVAGIITGNKTLSMIGMGLGLVGGVGALASAALGGSEAALFGTQVASSAAETTATAGTAGVSAFEGAGTVAPDTFGALAGTTGTDVATASATPALEAAGSPAITNTVGNAADTVASVAGNPAPLDAGYAAGQGLPDTSYSASTAPAAGTPTTNPVTGASNPSGAADTGAAGAGAGGAPGTPPTSGTPSPFDAAGGNLPNLDNALTPPAPTSMFDKLTTFVGKNPMVAFGAVQGVSSLLGGWTSTLTPAQVAQLNAQAASNQAAANFQTQQTNNLNQPKATASTAPVTGAPQSLVPFGSAPGFMNNQAQHLVTGRVA